MDEQAKDSAVGSDSESPIGSRKLLRVRQSRSLMLFVLKTGLAALVAFVAGLVVVEIWAKRFTRDCWQYQRADPELGWSFKPHAVSHALIAGDGGWFYKQEMRINSRGLRDDEYAIPKPAGLKRILVIGDSFVENAQFPPEKNYLRILARMATEAEGRTVEVLNGGHGVYGTDQELMFYQRDARAYTPDIVILMMLPANDFSDCDVTLNDVAQAPKYFFEVGKDGALERTPNPVLPPRVMELRSNLPATDRLLRRTWSYPLFKSYMRMYHRGGATLLESFGIFDALASYHPEGYPIMFEVLRSPLRPHWQRAGERCARIAARMKHEVEADGAVFVLVIIPFHTTMAEAYGEGHRPMARWVPDEKVNLAAPEELARNVLDAEGLQYFDLSEPLIASIRETGEAVNLRHDGHFNEHGHRVVANLLLEHLQSRGLVGKEAAERIE